MSRQRADVTLIGREMLQIRAKAQETIAVGGVHADGEFACKTSELINPSLDGRVVGLIPSPIEGGDGNREFLVGASQ